MRPGFVAFEGIDGSGKTTVSSRVHAVLQARGERVVLTAEPTSEWLGDAVRRSYAEDVGPIAESFLFLADRARHVDSIRRLVAEGHIVLCDRYADSTFAYQGARLEGVVEDPIGSLRRTSESWLLAPDLTILIRVTAELGMTRIRDRPHRVRFEDLAFLRKVAANYDILARGEGHVVLDGGRPMDEVVGSAIQAIEKALR